MLHHMNDMHHLRRRAADRVRAARVQVRAQARVLRHEPPSLVEGGLAFMIAFIIAYVAQFA